MTKVLNPRPQESRLSWYMGETRKYAMLDAETETALARRWRKTRDAEAAGQLVGSHLRLVAKIARSYRGYGQPLSDLIAEGNLGLMQALQHFDPERGVRFSTYAVFWIRAQLQDYVMRSSSLVRIGTTAAQKKLFFTLRRAQAELGENHGGDPSPAAVTVIADKLNVRESEVIDMGRRLAARDASLNARVGTDGDAEWQDYLMDDAPDQEKRLVETDEFEKRSAYLDGALEQLNERERQIVIGRRLKDDPLTLQDLSRQYGISRERVRQIEVRAMQKLGRLVRARAMAA
ncbi:MAG: RNA polymerase factor sigma-32 [Alphaproteobacteria bacterium]